MYFIILRFLRFETMKTYKSSSTMIKRVTILYKSIELEKDLRTEFCFGGLPESNQGEIFRMLLRTTTFI
jgi:hypothetical protein